MRLMNIKPGRQMRFYLAALPFVLLAIAYFAGSSMRLAENPNDKLLPALPSMAQAVKHMAFEIDVRTGTNLMLSDTAASLGRLLSALAISTAAALAFGIVIGLLPGANALLASFVGVTSMVPPLALLPILFIVMGPKKLPELGRGLGEGIRGLKDALAGLHGGKKDEDDVKRPA